MNSDNRIMQFTAALAAGLLYLARFAQSGGQPELEKRLKGQWILVLGVIMIALAGAGITPLSSAWQLDPLNAALIGAAGFGLIFKNGVDDDKAIAIAPRNQQGSVG